MTDYALEATIDKKFTTRAFATGIPTTLAGTPTIEIYEDNNDTPITVGITLAVDVNSRTGLNKVRILATAANGFQAGSDYSGVISAGTVSGVSVVGEVVFEFSIQKAPVNWANVTAPTTTVVLSGTTVGVTTLNTDMRGTNLALLATSAPTNFSAQVISGAGAVDSLVQGFLNTLITEGGAGRIANSFGFHYDVTPTTTKTVDDTGGGGGLTPLASGTAQGGTISTIQLAASETFADDELNGNMVKIVSGTGSGQVRLISDYVGATDTATVATNWITTPDATSVYEVVEGSLQPTVLGRTLDVTATGTAGINWANVDSASSLVNLSNTTVNLVNTTTIAANMRGTDGVDDATMRGTDGVDTAPMVGTDGANTVVPPSVTEFNARTLVSASYALEATVAALNDVSTADLLAQANAALDTAISELSQGKPTATPSVRTGLMLLYHALRNRLDANTAGSPDVLNIYNNAGTVIAKKQLTDDGADYSEAQIETGP